jgi:hypothetical protein
MLNYDSNSILNVLNEARKQEINATFPCIGRYNVKETDFCYNTRGQFSIKPASKFRRQTNTNWSNERDTNE